MMLEPIGALVLGQCLQIRSTLLFATVPQLYHLINIDTLPASVGSVQKSRAAVARRVTYTGTSH